MAKYIQIDGERYLIRGPWTPAGIRNLYRAYCNRYGEKLSLARWAAQRGKIYFKVRSKHNG